MISIENFSVKVYFRLKIINIKHLTTEVVFQKSYNYYNFQNICQQQ